MAGKKPNAVDDLAAGFLSTRPPAFDQFLQQPTITLISETTDENQRSNNNEEKASITLAPPEISRVDQEKKGQEDHLEQVPFSPSTETSNSIGEGQTDQPSLVKRAGPATGKSKKLVGPYEDVFLAKSKQYPSDHSDLRLYIKQKHARLLNRMVLYSEQRNQRISLQAILDNILQHHFEQYAPEIKQIDLQLINLLTQQIND